MLTTGINFAERTKVFQNFTLCSWEMGVMVVRLMVCDFPIDFKGLLGGIRLTFSVFGSALVVSQLEPGLAVKARCPANTPTTCEEGSTQHLLVYCRHLSVYYGSSIKRPGLTSPAESAEQTTIPCLLAAVVLNRRALHRSGRPTHGNTAVILLPNTRKL
jgi:hypothetical protein